MAKNTCPRRVTGVKVKCRRKTRSIWSGQGWASVSGRKKKWKRKKKREIYKFNARVILASDPTRVSVVNAIKR